MIDALLQPIDGPSTPVGEDCQYNEKYELLEDIMSQYGGLHQGDINWDDVEGISSLILKHECKHFKVLLFYTTSLLMQYTHGKLVDSLQLVSGFVANYLDNGFPKGKRGGERRRRLVEQTLDRISQLGKKRLLVESYSETTNAGPLNKDMLDRLQTALQQLDTQLAAVQVENPLKSMRAEIDNLRQGIAQATPRKKSAPRARPSSPSPSTRSANEEKRFKAELIDMANQYVDQQPDSPLGYLLRRHVKWQGIHNPPPTKADSLPGQTEMSPPNIDNINDYREQLRSQQLSLELLNQIEQTVMNATFWLSGSIYAAQVAAGLGYPLVTGSVILALEQLLDRVPKLADCTFSDGTPFLDKDAWQAVRTMIAREGSSGLFTSVQPTAAALEWQSAREDIQLVLETSGIGAALETIEGYRQRTTSPREAYYLKVFACETLRQAGVLGLSRDMLNAAIEHVKQMPVSEWEPDYFQWAAALLDSIEGA